jgi:hypothetical protein
MSKAFVSVLQTGKREGEFVLVCKTKDRRYIVSLEHKGINLVIIQFSRLCQQSVMRTRKGLPSVYGYHDNRSFVLFNKREKARDHSRTTVINSNGRQGQSHLARLLLGQLRDRLPCLIRRKGRKTPSAHVKYPKSRNRQLHFYLAVKNPRHGDQLLRELKK